MIARSLLAAGAVATVAVGGAQSSGSAVNSGLYGTVRLSPAEPVCGTTCTVPARNFKLSFSGHGRTVLAKTDSRGRYRVRLTAGRYVVHAPGRNISPKAGLQPSVVTVPRGRFAKRNFLYDSGIR